MGQHSVKIESELTSFDSWEDLSDEDRTLVSRAKEVGTQAYAPYSKFKVGAAVLLKNGVIVTGSNQENAAYPSGLCAERVALFAAHSTYPGEPVVKLAVYATAENHTAEKPVSPCGACRQVISEYEFLADSHIDILMASDDQVLLARGIESILPLRFKLSS